MESNLTIKGSILTKKISARKAPLNWKISNILTTPFLRGLFAVTLAKVFSKLTNIPTIISDLKIKVHKASGEQIDYGTVSYRCVTDTGVAYVVDCWDNTGTVLANLNFHGCGIGAGAEVAAETALVNECTTALNPDNTRATGTRSQPAANQYRTIGTLTFDAGASVIEHGILSQAATGGGVLWDRSLFSVITVASGDSIQFTYTVTLTAGS